MFQVLVHSIFYMCYVQVGILYKLQFVQVDVYKFQNVQILDMYKLQLVKVPYLSDEQCILMNLYFKFMKSTSDLHD